ncbi:DUF6651 domain-containing protein [Paraburkholderia sp. RCC_158]|uniref:DUF6651 domain-containing protein n=1 Tax=Paraburkholderia sp. RCC_158 TaxID=3239220 RepID=UPI0035269595
MRFRNVKQTLIGRGYWAPQGDEGGAGSGGGAGGEGGGEGGAGGAGAGTGNAGGEGGQGGQGDPAPTGGKKPTDTEAALLREVMDKKEKLKTKDAELATAAARLKEFDGLDPKELRALVQAKKDAEVAQLEAKGQWDALKSQMVEQHGAALKERDDKLTASEQRAAGLESQIAELTVGNAFGSSKFISDELTLSVAKARRVYGSHFEFQDGQVVAFDKPAGAKDRHVLVDAKGEPLAFDAALAKLVDIDPDKDSLLKSKLKAGAGSNTNPAAAVGASPNRQVVGHGRAKIAAGLAKAGVK